MRKNLKNRIVYHLYFLIVLYYIWDQALWKLRDKIINVPVDPVNFIAWMEPGWFQFGVKAVALLLLINLMGLIAYPWGRWRSLLCLILWLLLFAYESSFGKVFNHHYPITFSLIIFVIYGLRKNDFIYNQSVLMMAKFNALMCYFLAGLWKIRYIPQLIKENDFSNQLGNVIILEHLIYSYEMSELSQFVVDNTPIATAMFIGAIAIQSTSVLFLYNQVTQIIFGVLIMLFHLGSHFILHIDFHEVILIMGLLFIIEPIINFKSQECFKYYIRRTNYA